MMRQTIVSSSVTQDDVESCFNGPIARDFQRLMCGRFLGGGVGRGVFEFAPNPELVVKIETRNHSFQNVMEWEVWTEVQEYVASKWFAPCHSISPCGIVLLQSRTYELDKSQFPKKMPAFFSDLKYQNFGMLNKQIVAHDYGVSHLIEVGMTKEMRVADWHNDVTLGIGI